MEIQLLVDRSEFAVVVSSWLFEQFGYLSPGASRERAELRVRERMRADGYPVAFVATEQNVPIWTVSIVDSDLEECPNLGPWLGGLFVLSEYRQQGFGALLANAAAQYAKHDQARKLYLFTPDKQAFFRKLHWVHTQELVHHGVAVAVMERAL